MTHVGNGYLNPIRHLKQHDEGQKPDNIPATHDMAPNEHTIGMQCRPPSGLGHHSTKQTELHWSIQVSAIRGVQLHCENMYDLKRVTH